MRLFPASVIHRLPAASKVRPENSNEVVVVNATVVAEMPPRLAPLVVNPDWPITKSGSWLPLWVKGLGKRRILLLPASTT